MSKIIIVPKNKEAQIALDFDMTSPEQIVELTITSDEFNRLWNDGLFSLIDKTSKCTIDEFEDEHITDLELISKSLYELKKRSFNAEKIIKMFELALLYKTSIHFYF